MTSKIKLRRIVLLPVFIGFLALSPFSPQAERQHGPTSTHLTALREGLELVPDDAMQEVSAQSSLLPRLSQRANAWEFPQAAARVDWVVVDRYTHRSTQSVSTGYDAALANVRATFEQVYDRDGVEDGPCCRSACGENGLNARKPMNTGRRTAPATTGNAKRRRAARAPSTPRTTASGITSAL